MEKADAPLMRCLRMTLPCTSITQTQTGTLVRDAAASTRSATFFAKVSKSMRRPLLRPLMLRPTTTQTRASAADAPRIEAQTLFNVSGLMKPCLEQSFELALRCRPGNGCHAGVPPSRDFDVGRQTGCIDKTLRIGDRPLVECSNAGRESLDEPVEFRVRQRSVHIAV